MAMNQALAPTLQSFLSEGYATTPSVVSDRDRLALTKRIVAQFSRGICHERSHQIGSYDFRAHIPISLDDLLRTILTNIVERSAPLLREVLPGPRELVELSTLTVFPGARAQDWHPDVKGDVVSVFVPMYPTHEGVGALEVIAGSHRFDAPPSLEVRSQDGQAVLLDAGCAVVMQSSLWHRGGANRSIDRIRPVFYASFGNPNLEGPTYSILDSERGRYTLEEFVRSEGHRRYNWTLGSAPRIAPGMAVTQSLSGETLYLSGPGGIVDGFACGPKAAWLRALLHDCAHGEQAATLAEIASASGRDPAEVLRVVASLAEDGWLTH